MAKFRIIFFVTIVIPFLAICQEKPIYTNQYPDHRTAEQSYDKPLIKPAEPGISFIQPGYNLRYPTFKNIYILQQAGNTSQHFTFDTNKYYDESSIGIIKRFDNNYIIGSGEFSNLPSIGVIRRANIFYTHSFGKFTVSAGVTAAKYTLATGAYNNFGVSGNLNYTVNENLSFNVFGSYHTNNSFHSAAALPYLLGSHYGASMSMNFNERIGMTLGAQRYYDPFSGRWITTPIITPTFKVGNSSIGIDFGELMRWGIETLYNNQRQSNNRTIQPEKTPVLVRSVDLLGR